jgi:hypothetical protein
MLVMARGDTLPAASYQVRSGHPRLFFDQAMLADLAKRCDAGGCFQASYENMKKGLAIRQMNPKSAYFPGSGSAELHIALACLIEQQLGRDGGRYLDHIKTRLWKADGAGIDVNFGWDAIAYDWLFSTLTPEERKCYGDRLGKCLRHYTNKPEITLADGTYWYNQTWSANMAKSWSRDGIAPKTMIALTILGEGTAYETDARAWLDSFAKRMPDEFVRKLDQLSGVWPEGPGHGSVVYEPFLAWEAWRFNTGEDLFARVAPTGFHREVPLWWIYGRVPHTGAMAHTDDTGPGSFFTAPQVPLRAIHAARYRDSISQRQVSNALSGGHGDWPDLVWFDPSVAAGDLTKLPLAYHFAGSGQVFMRSAWNDPDATWAMFSAGPYFTAYGTWGKNGTFQVCKQGVLAGNGGYMKTTMPPPINQNVVLVYDPKEKYFGHSGKEARNDGGPQMPQPWHVLEPLERGEILAFESSDAYTYVGADLTKAYSNRGADAETKARLGSEKIRGCTRQFLYVRGNPEFFVIYDRVDASNASFPKTWVLHTLNEPLITAGEKPAAAAGEGAGFKTFRGGDCAFCNVTSRNGKGQWQTAMRGALAVRTLLPENAVLTTRGGKGFEMWGNPHDAKAGNLTDEDMAHVFNDMDVCYWRLEVEPPDRQEYHRFLHVLIPYGDAAGKTLEALSPTARAFELSGDAEYDGLRLALDGTTWEIRFAKSGPMGGSVKIHKPGSPPQAASLATEIRPNVLPPGMAVGLPVPAP